MYGKVMSIPDDLLMDYFELLTDVPDKELAEFRQQLAVQSVNPMILKKRLAGEIVGQFHSAEAARKAESHFEKVVQRKETPAEMEEFPISFYHLREIYVQRAAAKEFAGEKIEIIKADDTSGYDPLNFVMRIVSTDRKVYVKFHVGEFLHLSGLIENRSEAKRLVTQGAVTLDDVRIESFTDIRPISNGSVVKIGKRRWVKIVDADAKQ
jgi:tyrosyl-tRNA synthetase